MIIEWKKFENPHLRKGLWSGYVHGRLTFQVIREERTWGKGYQLLKKDDQNGLWFLCDKYSSAKGAMQGALQDLPPLLQLAALKDEEP